MAGINKTSNKLIGANEDMFLQAFDSTPKLNIATQKKLEAELARVVAIISNTSAEWDQRVQAMKLFRSLISSGVADQDDFYTTTLRNLEQKFSRMAEIILPCLIKLIPNCAKIVSTSALVALRFIIQSTHSSKFISIIKYQLYNSKSKEIHRALCEIVERIATIWPPQVIERNMNDFIEVLKLGICDSDEMARQNSRRAFNAFAEHFREHADRLFNSLDGQRQRMLNNLNHGGGSTLSMNGYGGSATSGLNTIGIQPASLSSHPTNHYHNHPTANAHHNVVSSGYGQTAPSHTGQVLSRLKSALTSNSNGNSSASSSASSGSSIPAPPNPTTALSHVYQTTNRTTGSPSRIRTPTARSTSAIDVDAQRRARARAVYLSSIYQRPRQLGSTLNNNVTPSPIKSNLPQPIHSIHQSPAANHSTASAQLHKTVAPSTPVSYMSHSTTLFQTPQSTHKSQFSQNSLINNVSKLPQPHQQPTTTGGDQRKNSVTTQQQQPQNQQQPQLKSQVDAAYPTKPAGETLSKTAAYLLSVMKDSQIDVSQIVTTIKYFNALIDKQTPTVVNQLVSELMPPLVFGIDNAAISVRKETVFAMVAIYAKVGLKEMEPYLTSLTVSQRRLLEVYIKRHDEESKLVDV